MSRLILHEPSIDDSIAYCTYTHGNDTYRHRFTYPASLGPADPVTIQLLRWMSAIHALYLFDFDYFTELSAEYPLDDSEIAFFEKLAYNGMAEFRQVNHLPMDTRTHYISVDASAMKQPTDVGVEAAREPSKPSTSAAREAAQSSSTLLLNGGGKDGCVSATLLDAANIPFTWFMLNSSVAQDAVATVSGHPGLKIKRLIEQRAVLHGKYHGHRPTSASIAISAVLAAHLGGMSYVVASNEQSANEGNGLVDGVHVNHQYSKSVEFERDFTALLEQHGVGVQYFSLLRPLHELQIVQIAAKQPKYLGTFTSCNHGYKRGEWCLACAKCAFVALTLTAVDPSAATRVWGTDIVLNQPGLQPYIRELLDPDLQKPLECVGTLQECQLAARMLLDSSIAGKFSHDLAELLQRYAAPANPGVRSQFMGGISSDHNVPETFAVALQQAAPYLG